MLLSVCVESLESWSEGGELPEALAGLAEGVLMPTDRAIFAAGAAPAG